MLGRYGFRFEENDGRYWGFISANPNEFGADGHVNPIYFVSNGIIRADAMLSYYSGSYGYLNSKTIINNERAYSAIASKKITASVSADNWFGVSLRF